jgi:hypothetical protein
MKILRKIKNVEQYKKIFIFLISISNQICLNKNQQI